MNVYHNDQQLNKHVAMYDRNWHMIRDKWEKDRVIDLDLAQEMNILWIRMEEMIPQSHYDEINKVVYGIERKK